MSHPGDENENILLAYLRGELDVSDENALIQRLRDEPALREDLAVLEAIKARFLTDDFDAREDELFTQFQQQMRSARRVSHHATKTSMWQPLIDWFRRHALVLEGALALLVIAQAATLASFLYTPPATNVTTPMYRGTNIDCLNVHIRFQPGVTEQQITRWLGRHDANIKAGPDRQGRYRIALPTRDALEGFLSDPDTKTLVGSIAPPPGCTLPVNLQKP